ncbi:hypothetical protein D3C84_695260 [compost metagenome]
MIGAAGNGGAIPAAIPELDLGMGGDVTLKLDAVASKAGGGHDNLSMTIEYPVLGLVQGDPQVAHLPSGVSLPAGEGQVDPQQDDLPAAHAHGEIGGWVDDASPRVEQGLG